MEKLREVRSDEGSSGDIQAVSRVCSILALLAERQSLTAAEVVELVGLQRSTASRYLSSLTKEGFLERRSDASYEAGAALQTLGVAMIDASPVADAGPYMQRLAAELSETVVLSLWGGDGPVISRVEEDTSRLVHVSVRQGSALPYDSAQAQVFLAYMSHQQEIRGLIERLPELTQRDLATQMEHVHRNGFAINSRVVQGVRAVAAPTFGRDGRIESTVAVVGTVNSIPQTVDSPVIQSLLDTAKRISWHRGYRESTDGRKSI